MMKTIVLTLIFAVSLFSLQAQFQVGETTITFNDPGRTGGFGSGGGPGRQIQSEIYYPATSTGVDVAVANGEFPVIVFGHGFSMTWSAYENIWEEMVPKGYIMVFPRTEGGFLPDHEDFGLDLALLVGEMQILNNDNTSLFYQKVLPKSAIMGHSMGGGASFLAAENNTSIETVIGLAPAETNPSAIAAAQNVQVPTLVFSGSSDGVTPPVDHHIPIYNAVTSCKYFISMTGGAHCYFANSNFNCDFGEATSSSGISISRQDQQEILYDYITPWLERYLYNNCSEKGTFNTLLNTDSRVTFQESCPENLLSLTPSGPLELCDGEDVTISAPQSVEWYDQSTGNSVLVSQTQSVFGFDPATCQYTDTLNVTAIPTITTNENATICSGDTYAFPDGTTSSTDVVHVSTLQSLISGCDSLVETTLTVVASLDTSVSQTGSTLTSNATGVNYQWIDCENNTAIPGASQAAFTPADPGSFAVEISAGTCVDTSFCYIVEASSIEKNDVFEVKIFPNPGNEVLYIQSPINGSVVLMNSEGRQVAFGKVFDGECVIQVEGLAKGLYFVKFNAQAEGKILKWIKK